MPLAQTVEGDLRVIGTVLADTLIIQANAIESESQLKPGINIPADKTEQRLFPEYSQPNTAATSETRTLFVARRPGTVNEVVAGSIAKAAGNATVTVDLRKNGTTILSAVITLDNANNNRIVEAGTISSGSGSFVAGDWFEVVFVATVGSGTLPTGVFVQLEVDQDGL
jgi:uncharacterized lipoprotein